MSKKSHLTQVYEELSPLVFARVSSISLKDEFIDKYTTAQEKEKSYMHYFGFAKIESNHPVYSGSVWFKRATHMTRNGGLFFGPVSHAPLYSKEKEIPSKGDIIVGKITKLEKGLSFVWWTHAARPFLNFRAFAMNTRRLNNDVRAFNMLKLEHTRSKTTDDLYMMAHFCLKQNVSLLVKQMFSENEKPRHPWLKDTKGYQRKRGLDLEYHPVEFAYFTCLFSKNTALYATFLEEMKKHEAKIVDWPEEKLTMYSLELLKKNVSEKQIKIKEKK